jgi:hypothetical protein
MYGHLQKGWMPSSSGYHLMLALVVKVSYDVTWVL